MNGKRWAAGLVVLGVVGLPGTPALAAPSGLVRSAHGALSKPPSRAFACGPEGASQTSAACQAAAAKSAKNAFVAWDNIRQPDVDGRDRQVIKDGRLCSAGRTAYAGLDLARADWPATKVNPGATLSFAYRQTIGHKGTFELYLTKAGYDPTKALTWADLDTKPFVTVTDPAVSGESYTFKGKLPQRTGRHLIYTIWRNSNTPDTYYSCADVVFPAAVVKATPTPKPADKPVAVPTESAPAAGTVKASEPAATSSAPEVVATEPLSNDGGPDPGLLVIGGAAALVVIGALGGLAAKLRRRA